MQSISARKIEISGNESSIKVFKNTDSPLAECGKDEEVVRVLEILEEATAVAKSHKGGTF